MLEKASCPECGRTYCLESINQSLNAGKHECPYCDTPIEWFPEIPLPIKKSIRRKKLSSPHIATLSTYKTPVESLTFIPEIDLKTQLNAKNREIVVLQKNVESLTKENRGLEEKTAKLMNAIETYRINLAKNPKYAILFVLQDVQQTTLTELAKTVAIQNVFATRLLKELESEGWISYNEVNGHVRLEKALLELD